MILLVTRVLAAAESLPGDTSFWESLFANAPGLGAVGLVVVLLFRTYWRAEDRDERQVERMERELASLRAQNERLQDFIANRLVSVTQAVAESEAQRIREEAQIGDAD